jgi:hypothetical protein
MGDFQKSSNSAAARRRIVERQHFEELGAFELN